MKHTINNIGWMGIIISTILCLLFSCKKEDNNQIKTNSGNGISTSVNDTVYYRLVSPRQCDEANTFYIINNNKIRQPIVAGISFDSVTLDFPHFAGAIMQGAVQIYGAGLVKKDTIWLQYTEWQTVDNIQICQVSAAKYIKIK